jgi:hypothetical protein
MVRVNNFCKEFDSSRRWGNCCHDQIASELSQLFQTNYFIVPLIRLYNLYYKYM